MPRFDVEVQLIGQDSNAFSIMGRVVEGLQKAGATQEEINEYRMESMSGDYDHLLRVAIDWVEVV